MKFRGAQEALPSETWERGTFEELRSLCEQALIKRGFAELLYYIERELFAVVFHRKKQLVKIFSQVF